MQMDRYFKLLETCKKNREKLIDYIMKENKERREYFEKPEQKREIKPEKIFNYSS